MVSRGDERPHVLHRHDLATLADARGTADRDVQVRAAPLEHHPEQVIDVRSPGSWRAAFDADDGSRRPHRLRNPPSPTVPGRMARAADLRLTVAL